MRILLAEDVRVHARLTSAALEREGFAVTTVADGGAAWRALAGDEPPRLVILDWMMPVASGVEVCRRIRSDPRLEGIYVILLTARDRTEDLVQGLGAGANDFITKPFDPRELVARVRVGVRVLELEAALAVRLAELETALEERARAETELRQVREREVAIGERIQQALLLGTPPKLASLDIAALSTPSEGIDGDFYDFFVHGGECVDVVVGDVMGKGVPAALLSAAAKAHLLRALAALAEERRGSRPSPAEVMGALSRFVGPQLSTLESFATVCYARFDLEAGEVRLVDAGHTKTLHLRAGEEAVREISGEDLPIGVWEVQEFGEVSVSLAAGDLFVFYSDGVTEARSPGGELFGSDRLVDSVRANRGLAAGPLARSIHESVVAFSGHQRLADDLTCVVVRIPSDAPSDRVAAAELELTSSLEELARVRSHLEEVCRQAPASALGEEGVRKVVLAADEAFANVVKHAYRGRPDGVVRLETETSDGALTVRFRHGGVGFDRDRVSAPAFDGSRASGFGLHIMERSVDEVRYEVDEDGGQVIVLVKRLPAGPEPGSPPSDG